MSLSKSAKELSMNMLSTYLQALYSHPLRTNSITSCLIAALGNFSFQLMSREKFDLKNFSAFSAYGLLFGGIIQHYFFLFLDRTFRKNSKYAVFKKLLFERAIYTPLYQLFFLYMLSRFEGKNHETCRDEVKILFEPVLKINWNYLTAIQFANFWMVPPMFRVFAVHLIEFIWNIIVMAIRKNRTASTKRNR